jgi:hypothetical protein
VGPRAGLDAVEYTSITNGGNRTVNSRLWRPYLLAIPAPGLRHYNCRVADCCPVLNIVQFPSDRSYGPDIAVRNAATSNYRQTAETPTRVLAVTIKQNVIAT